MILTCAARRLSGVTLALCLAGCNASPPPPIAQAPAPTASLRYTPPDFQLPQGAGCSGDVARWQAIQENDRQMGHVTLPVYTQIQSEISQAAAVCQAGRDGEARGLVTASKRRHGYPA